MKTFKNILFYILIGLIPIGFLFRVYDYNVGDFLLLLGLLGIFIYFITRLIKDVSKKSSTGQIRFLHILIILMSVTLFSRYYFHRFGDYPNLLITPIFILTTFYYLIKTKNKENKLTTVTVLYLILTIPLFGFNFHNSPRHYYPKEWYDRYDVSEGISVTIPYGFLYHETEKLSNEAFKLHKSQQYNKAIVLYREALKLEPKNPYLLFDLSDNYARINDLETAISLLDTAILLDSSCPLFYNNRGLLFYKLKENDKAIADYKKAIEIDSTQFVYFSNLALVYYYEDLYELSCEAIEKAEKLGLDTYNYKELRRIKSKHCE